MYIADDFVKVLRDIGLDAVGDQTLHRVKVRGLNHTIEFNNNGDWRHYPDNTLGHRMLGKMASEWYEWDKLEPYWKRFPRHKDESGFYKGSNPDIPLESFASFYYTVNEMAGRSAHGQDILTWDQEKQLIGMLRRWKKPYPTASEIILWANDTFGTSMSTEKSVANKRLRDIFIRHQKPRIKRRQGLSKV